MGSRERGCRCGKEGETNPGTCTIRYRNECQKPERSQPWSECEARRHVLRGQCRGQQWAHVAPSPRLLTPRRRCCACGAPPRRVAIASFEAPKCHRASCE
eukprot:5363821-Pleurochrysis_carterae.AAC.1